MRHDPWYKTVLPIAALGTRLSLQVPHDVFSTQRIDEGTLLLLENLPGFEPSSVLDLGCGYGALGLPIAAKFPRARIEMVDRDLLAVKWAAANARSNQLENAFVHGSLGYRDLAPEARYDWILCNVPARIGRPFIEHLVGAGRARLAAGGELRIVVIRDLAPLIEELGAHWPIRETARGPRHVIFSLPADPASTPAPLPDEPIDLYLRDAVTIGGLRLERPFDLGGDDPRRLASGLPVLIDVLPRQPVADALCFRSAYGALPLISCSRWPTATVTAMDRDLLGTTFTRRNRIALGIAEDRLILRESAHFPEALTDNDRFQLAIGELSPSAGEKVAQAELHALAKALKPGGEGLILMLEKFEKDLARAPGGLNGLSVHRVIARDGYTVLRLAPATRSR